MAHSLPPCVRCGGPVVAVWVLADAPGETLERIAACTLCGEEYPAPGPQGREPGLAYVEAETLRLLLAQGARPTDLHSAFGVAWATLYAIKAGTYRGYTDRDSLPAAGAPEAAWGYTGRAVRAASTYRGPSRPRRDGPA